MLENVLSENNIVTAMQASSCTEALSFFSKLYAEHASVDASKVYSLLLERENQGSTALANGVAFPHARLDSGKSSVYVGISEKGIKWINGETIHVVFLLLGPKDKPSEHIGILSSLARIASSPVLLSELKHAKSAKEVLAIMEN